MIRSILVALSVVWGLSAHAEERPHALVLPTELGGYVPDADDYRLELDVTLEERLRTSGFDVVRPGKLSRADAVCGEESCLRAIAIRRKTSVVVAARMRSDEREITTYHLRVLAFLRDASGGALRSRERDCVQCSQNAVRDQLGAMLSAVIANEPDAVALAPSDAGATDGGTPDGGAMNDGGRPIADERRIPINIRVAEGALGLGAAIGITAVALGAKFLADDGRLTCSLMPPMRQCDTEVRTAGVGVGFLVGGALLAAGAAVGIWAVEVKLVRSAQKKVTLVPSFFPGGGGLSLSGSL